MIGISSSLSSDNLPPFLGFVVKNYIDSGSKEYLFGTKLCSLNIC